MLAGCFFLLAFLSRSGQLWGLLCKSLAVVVQSVPRWNKRVAGSGAFWFKIRLQLDSLAGSISLSLQRHMFVEEEQIIV